MMKNVIYACLAATVLCGLTWIQLASQGKDRSRFQIPSASGAVVDLFRYFNSHNRSEHVTNTGKGESSSFVSFYATIAAFSDRTSEACPMSEHSTSFCPARTPDGSCKREYARSLKELDRYIQEQAEPVPLVADDQFFFQFERRMLEFPPLQDIKDTPSLNLSRLSPINAEVNDDVIRCESDDVIEMRLDLLDGWGNSRTEGFDDVRAWMVGEGGNRAVGGVRDLHNGSYVITFTCLWPASSSQLNVGVAYPREYLRRVLQEKRLGMYRLTAAAFGKKDVKEEWTPCFSTPNIPWPCLCNFTEVNNASFYCGRPRDPRLACTNILGTATLDAKHSGARATEAEIQLLASMEKHYSSFKIKQTFTLKTGTARVPNIPEPCSKIPLQSTWNAAVPKGYFDGNGYSNWHPVMCSSDHIMSGSQIDECHRDTTVHLFGDSNVQRMKILPYMLKEDCQKGLLEPWNFRQVCRSEKLNYTLTFDPHENHMYFTKHGYWELYKDGGVAKHLDDIPSTGRHIVIVHYYLHVLAAHLSAAHNRLCLLRDAIVRLTDRNPQVFVVFRGPHPIQVDWPINHSMGGDTQSLFYNKIIEEIFQPLMDRMIFLDGWEMGTAIENKWVHPKQDLADGMMRLVLALTCGRQNRTTQTY